MERPSVWFLGLMILGGVLSCRDSNAPQQGETESSANSPIARPATAEETRDAPEPDSGPASPLYPTASAAGTEKLFLLEEPDRGAHVTKVDVPRGGKIVMKRGHCELDEHDVICMPGNGNHRVRRIGPLTIAEEMRGERIEATFVVERAPSGELVQLAKLNRYNDVEWVRSYKSGGKQYSARRLDGSNELDGCGSHLLNIDRRGRAASVTCMQWNGTSPMRDTSGVVRTNFQRNGQGLIETATFLGLDEEPVERHDGTHTIVYKRSPQGRVLQKDYFGIDNKPALSTKRGCASELFEFDDSWHSRSKKCLGTWGDPVAGIEGAAEERFERNDEGCVVANAYYDEEGKPVKSRHGWHEMRFVVNSNCEPVEETCYDEDKEAVACEGSVFTRKLERDDSGRVTSIKHFAADGGPTVDPALSRFELRYRYDERGNRVEQACFSKTGEPAICVGTGVHAFVEVFDGAGRSVEARFLDVSRTPTDNLGIFVRRSIYDNYDHQSRAQGEDLEGRPVTSFGMSQAVRFYDAGHRFFGMQTLDADGQPAEYSACFVGLDCPTRAWQAMRIVRSPSGHATANVFFDARKREINTFDCTKAKCWDE